MNGGDAFKPPANEVRISFAQLREHLRFPTFVVVWLAPFAVYMLLCFTYTFTFIRIPSVCVLLSVFFGLASAALFLMRSRGPLFLPLAFGGSVAVATGTLFGLYVYDKFAVFPRFYANSRLYANVVPSQPSAAVADAGAIVFTAESFVDGEKSVGYVTESGYHYCAAPIRDNSRAVQVEFWAVGMGCCHERGKFWCDDSEDPQARAGITVFDNNGFFDAASNKDQYIKARLKAEATFGLFSVKDPMYVRWVREDNLNMLSRQYSHKTLAILLLLSFVHLVGFLGMAFVLWKPHSVLLWH
uniref:Uncharacterized protein n=2 Tax=Pyrodinium bahamense TaxID=73915 RepID=A0A7S0F8Q1_9DINO|mmetsp:Transcript_12372/g.34009  ORF Transcript_12372/g.34009 Transcript_12372/m.34009 type:complete len:299 (+) Transcript_12372:82-978(+)